MDNIIRRLNLIRYQPLRSKSLTDAQKVHAVRSIYDAVIKPGFEMPEGLTFPTEEMGVSLSWGENYTSVQLSLGDITIYDNLIDDYVPSVEGFSDYLAVNGDLLQLNDEHFLEISAA